MTRKFDPALLPPSPDLSQETPLWAEGIKYIAGIDEAGRGALAGPVAAAAVILPPDHPKLPQTLNGVRDSKQMTPRQRAHWADQLPLVALAVGVGFATCEEIDQLGIVPATRLAAQRALDKLSIQPQHLLLDYLLLHDNPLPQTSLPKGDARSLSIAAASVMAKTIRDAHMVALSDAHPAYGFAAHKGYGTAFHRAALQEHGPTPVHRFSFRPLSELQLELPLVETPSLP